METERRVAPAAERNKVPILETLRARLPRSGNLLEIASGYGQHALFLAEHLPAWTVFPSDVARENVATIEAWRRHHPLANLQPPRILDVEMLPWPVREHFDAVLNINMIHISPWSATVALFEGASRVLRPGGMLLTYGPYRIAGAHTAESNASFDQRLRAMDPRFGVRDLEALEEVARAHGFELPERIAMPANNFVLCFQQS